MFTVIYHSFDDLSEHDMSAVEPRRLDGRDEELRPIRVLSCVRHRQPPRSVVLQSEVLIVELVAIN